MVNIFEYYKEIFLNSIDKIAVDDVVKNKITVETPKQKKFGDISFNAPLILGSLLKKSPMVLAENFKNLILKKNQDFEKIEIAEPGFINFTFKKEVICKFLTKINNNFGKINNIKKKKNKYRICIC